MNEWKGLRKCPFCGGEAVYCEDDSYNNEHTGCVECDVFFVGDKNTGFSREQWNRRAPNPEVVGHLEAQHRSAIENGKLRKEKADLVEMIDKVRDELERVAGYLMQPQSHMDVGLDHYSPAREKQRVVAILAAARTKWRYEALEAVGQDNRDLSDGIDGMIADREYFEARADAAEAETAAWWMRFKAMQADRETVKADYDHAAAEVARLEQEALDSQRDCTALHEADNERCMAAEAEVFALKAEVARWRDIKAGFDDNEGRVYSLASLCDGIDSDLTREYAYRLYTGLKRRAEAAEAERDHERRRGKWALKKARLYTDCSEHYADERDRERRKRKEDVQRLRDWHEGIEGLRLSVESLRVERDALKAEVTRLENELFVAGRMNTPPCFVCGYNGPSYYQPAVHPCAARHHAAIKRPGVHDVEQFYQEDDWAEEER